MKGAAGRAAGCFERPSLIFLWDGDSVFTFGFRAFVRQYRMLALG